jgi:hypothetical protein
MDGAAAVEAAVVGAVVAADADAPLDDADELAEPDELVEPHADTATVKAITHAAADALFDPLWNRMSLSS